MLDKLSHVPDAKRPLLAQLVDRLSKVDGVAAIALGGSYASHTQHDASDLDIGLYYFEASPFSIEEIRRIANSVSTKTPATVTDFYGWGAWVNGGAWIHTPISKVDFLYRNIDHVQRTIDEAQAGIWHHDYDQQPTHGFFSVIYLAETQICIPLFDPNQLIAKLKTQVEVYPPKLKETIIKDSLWSAEFTLLHARGFAEKGEIYNTVGCLTRVTSNLTQTLFALNERYFMRDKKVMDAIAAFPILPSDYVQRINRILSQPGGTAQALTESVHQLEQVWHDIVSLTGGMYQPKFQM